MMLEMVVDLKLSNGGGLGIWWWTLVMVVIVVDLANGGGLW